jgi:superfamily I DNA/RNA helicase
VNDGARLSIIVGGPGTGKTQTLVNAFLALQPEEQRRAVLLTATPAAARELSVWIRGLQPDRPMPRTVSFSQFAGSLLRLLRGNDVPSPLDEAERRLLLAHLIAGNPESTWARIADSIAEDVAAVIGVFQRHNLGPDDLKAFADSAAHQREDMGRLAGIYREYTDALSAAALYDYDSLGRGVLRSLDDQESLGRVQARHALFYVDEAQNLDPLQVALLARSAGATGRVLAAVDPSQRTQAYRGACQDAVAELERAMGTPAALRRPAGGGALPAVAVDALARFHNAYGTPGEPAAGSGEAGSLRHIVARDADDEADRLAGLLKGTIDSVAVLVRSSQAVQSMTERLAARGIPVEPPETAEACLVRRFVADALRMLAHRSDGKHGASQPLSVVDEHAAVNAATVRLLCTTRSDLQSRARAVEEQKRADSTASCLLDLHLEPPLSAVKEWLTAARLEDGVAAQVHRLFLAVRPHVVPGLNIDAIVGRYGAALGRLERLQTVHAACGNVLTPGDALAVLDTLLTLPDAQESRGAVEVLVPTSASGRRWSTVAIAGLNDGEFPQWAVPSPFFTDETVAEMEAWLRSRIPEGERVALGRFERGAAETMAEERRLFYSALARTKGDLILSCRLREGANDAAPSAFFLHCLPAGMAVAPRDMAGSWQCVLGRSLPDSDAGLASCADCLVASCAGRVGSIAASPYAFEARPDDVPSAQTGPPALTPDWPLSASDIEAYCECPRGFFLGRILKVVQIEGDDLTRGNLLHRAFEAFHKLARVDRTPEALRACFQSALRDSEAEFSTKAAFGFQKRQTLSALDTFLANPALVLDYEVLQAERSMRFTLKDSEGDGHPFVGRVDLVRSTAGGVEVVDFKGSAAKAEKAWLTRIPSETEDGPLPNGKDVSVQLPLYAIGLGRQADPVTVGAIVLEYVHHSGCRTVTLATGEGGALTPEGLATLERHVADLSRAIKSGTFLDSPRDGSCGRWNAGCPCEAICD